jgi:hypothetical protein
LGLLRPLAILLLVLAVALIVYDAALYLRGGAAWAITSVEKLWQMAGAERLFPLRSNLASAFGSAGDFIADLPAVILSTALALLCFVLGRRSARSVE